MNKYLKILMLSGGLIGSIGITAIDSKQAENNDLNSIYENVEKMQQVLPTLSRININLDTITDENNNQNKDDVINENLENNISNDTNDTDSNISFTTTDEVGNQKILNNNETLYYLYQTLDQTNTEYENLKTTLNNAIKDTMNYLDSYKNGDTALTNEQKVYIKEQANCIKFLAETLEDLSEDVICYIDGCEDCDDDFETTVGQYLSLIDKLEARINALNNAISSLQFINNISNPFFFKVNPNQIIYGYHYNSNEQEKDQDVYLDKNNQDINNTENNNITNQTDNITEDLSDENKDETIVDVENDNNDNISNDEKPTTFGLKSNIDTYAPTKRNIDTFFNTALYNNDYGNYNGYGYMPYGGYGMPYGGGFRNPYAYNFTNPYNREINSNLVNRAELEKQQDYSAPTNTSANIENHPKDDSKTDKNFKFKNIKLNKNIDTFTQSTVNSNINTMGESKLSSFFKQKINGLRNKIRKQKENSDQSKQLPNTAEAIDNSNSDSTTDSVYDNNITQYTDNYIDSNNDLNQNLTNNNSPINPKQTQDVYAR